MLPFQLLESKTNFEHIRDWANKRGLYDKGDVKTQLIKFNFHKYYEFDVIEQQSCKNSYSFKFAL